MWHVILLLILKSFVNVVKVLISKYIIIAFIINFMLGKLNTKHLKQCDCFNVYGTFFLRLLSDVILVQHKNENKDKI